jgi:tetratricopeptide (TPR) repeat protein
MARLVSVAITCLLVANNSWGQLADNRSILGAGNEFLSAGSFAIRMGQYDEGIRLTNLGLTRYQPNRQDRASALSNLCAAHAAKGEPDIAIPYCDESIEMNDRNWRAYSNRAYSYFLKGMLNDATLNLDLAADLNPDARQVLEIRGMINEVGLRPRVIMEDHQ